MTQSLIRFPKISDLLTASGREVGEATPDIKTSEFAFPQVNKPLDEGTRGICSITHGQRTFRFRTNPNSFSWTYTMNKRVESTYGGRVVQLLSTQIDDFQVIADCGGGRWEYANAITTFLRDVMIDQRGGEPATFEYTTRGWKLNVFIVSIPFQDDVGQVLREFTIDMKVQEDVSGVMSKNSLGAELRRLQDGIGFKRSKYNDPLMQGQRTNQEQPQAQQILANVAGEVTFADSATNQTGVPALAP
jgi:hypothetical protein